MTLLLLAANIPGERAARAGAEPPNLDGLLLNRIRCTDVTPAQNRRDTDVAPTARKEGLS